jgi:hypothetical protein
MDTPMRLKAIAAVCGILVSPGLSAQPAPAPAQITQRLDNEQVRAIVATLQPHTPSIARTGHATNRVLIYLDDGVMTREEAETRHASSSIAVTSGGVPRAALTRQRMSAITRFEFWKSI